MPSTKERLLAIEQSLQALILGIGMTSVGVPPTVAAPAAPVVATAYDYTPLSRNFDQNMLDLLRRTGLGQPLMAPEMPKRRRKPLRGMSAALKQANRMGKKKNGQFRVGWDQAKIMKTAHRIRKKNTSGSKSRRR